MGLILLNLQSHQEISLDKDTPFVIGRGVITGCADKRVSRSHGMITCTRDGKVNLIALHSNPCFFTKKGSPPVRQLNKNEEQVLGEGDCIGLLPNSYWYRVTTKAKAREERSNETGLQSSELIVPKTEVTPQVEVVDLEGNSRNAPTVNGISGSSGNESTTPGRNGCSEVAIPSSSGENSNLNIPPELRNTCRLPVQMYEIKGQKELEKALLKKNADSTNTKTPDLAKIREYLGVGATQRGAAPRGPAPRAPAPRAPAPRAPADAAKPGRPYCRYDGDCYRKNAQHKLEFSHPGDEDYVQYENRPMCEYGPNCYRRSLTHRRQFRHGNNQDPQTSQAADAPAAAATDDASAQGAAANPNPNPNPNQRDNGERRRRRHKRKRRDNKRSSRSRSCHLSVTVSASPKRKRRRSSSNHSSHYSSDYSYEDPQSSSEPFSDDYSSDDYVPSEDSGDDDAAAGNYGKNYNYYYQ